MTPSQPPSPPSQRPTVLSDTGPDGHPQAMLVTETRATVLDTDGALALIGQLLAVLSPDPAPALLDCATA